MGRGGVVGWWGGVVAHEILVSAQGPLVFGILCLGLRVSLESLLSQVPGWTSQLIAPLPGDDIMTPPLRLHPGPGLSLASGPGSGGGKHYGDKRASGHSNVTHK